MVRRSPEDTGLGSACAGREALPWQPEGDTESVFVGARERSQRFLPGNHTEWFDSHKVFPLISTWFVILCY